MIRTKLFVIILFILCSFQLYSQKWNSVQKNYDSIHFKPTQILITRDTFYISATDSVVVLKKRTKYRIKSNPYSKSKEFYDSLKLKSYRNQITRELYDLLICSASLEVQDTSNFSSSEFEYLGFKGLKIRNIRLLKVDVLAGSVHDTLIKSETFWAKNANKIHINTRDKIIFNNLTIKEGDLIDPVKMADNERVLRNYPYIEDARINIVPIPSDTSQVDILIITKDKFSSGFGLDMRSIDNFSTHYYNKNFIGIGQEMRHYLIFRPGYKPEYGYAFKYQINNILNSFTTIKINYENSWDKNIKGISINKEFLTRQTKYGGGLSFYNISDARDYALNDTTISFPYDAVIHDYWIGKSFILNKNKGFTFISSFRYTKANFNNRPFVSADSNYFFHNREMFLANFSILQRKYYLSSLVYGFGVTEDIPYGYKLDFLLGHENDQFMKRPYFAAAFSYGKHFNYPGFLMVNIEYGGFYKDKKLQNNVLKFRLLNIGNLIRLNRFSLRNFIDIDFQAGFNMDNPDSKAVINGKWTTIVSGLNKDGLKGRQKLTINYESVLFTPWYLLGFKFAMTGYLNAGWVSQEKFLKQNTFYANVGFGVRIKNESWIFETITLGFAYFLSAPKGSSNVGFIFDGSDPRLFRNLNPGKPDIVRMDQEPVLFSE
jgi:hypothetical protein